MEYIPLFLLGWIVVCLPAMLFTAIANSRRRNEITDLKNNLADLRQQLGRLENRIRAEAAQAQPSAVSAAPTVKIASQEAQGPVAPAQPVRETMPTAPEKPKAPIVSPQPIVPPVAVQTPAPVEPATKASPVDEPRVVIPAPPPPPPKIAPEPEYPPIAASVEASPWLNVPKEPEHASARVRASSMLSDFSSDARIALTPQLPKQAKKKSSISLEELVGTNLLPKLGIAIVVIGIGFLVAAKWGSFSPWLRVVLLYLVGFATLAGGIFAERHERYRTLGRSLIGGGWAITALVTYGLQHAPFMAILSSNAVDLLLLLGVIGVMVWHTLKYDSQLVTGAAFLLAFASIALNPDPPYHLIAGLLLISGMTVILLRRRWYELEIFGILASYLNHFYWLYRVFDKLPTPHTPFPYHTPSLLLAIAYWAIFRCSYVWRKVTTKEEESVSTIAGLLNPLLFLGVMKYQSFHPEWAFYALLVLGAVEFTLGQLPVSRRRKAPFRVLSSLGVALMVASVPFKYSGSSLEILWLVGAEVFLLAGVFLRERLFRIFGLLISILVVLYTLPTRVGPLLLELTSSQPHYHSELGTVLLAIAAVLYFNAHIIGSKWKELFAGLLEEQGLTALSYAASVFAVCGACALVNDTALALVLALFVTALTFLGRQFSISVLVYQAHWIAIAATFQTINSGERLEAVWNGIPERILTFVPTAALLYVSSRSVRLSATNSNKAVSAAYTWAATLLLSVLVWYQVPALWIGAGWITLAVVLALAARFWKYRALLWQTHVLSLLAALWTLYQGFSSDYRGTQAQLISVGVTVLALYTLNWITSVKEIIGDVRFSQAYSWAGSLLLSWLIWYQFPAIDVALAWGLLGLALFMLGDWKSWGFLRAQSYVALACSFAHIFYANFNVLGEPGAARPEIYTVIPLVGIYFFVYWQLHGKLSQAAFESKIRIDYLLACLGTGTLAALALFELPPETVPIAYAALVLSTLIAAWLTRLNIFLYQALALLALTVFRISMYNFYHFHELYGSNLSSAVITIVLLAVGVPICFFIRKNLKQTSDRTQWLALLLGHPEQPMFFVPFVLMAVLLALKAPAGMMTLAWGAQAVVVFVLALWAKERSFRLAGLILLLLCVAKIVFWDVWQLNDITARYLTLIGVGVLILVVSYLISRNREALRDYL